ncbi:MAG: RhuM family protein, partial [candidate division WOR-3 bacterium]
AHGHTAAEIIAARADAKKPNMGLTSWTGARPTQEDIEVAKNYLNAGELDTLNRIVTMYLDFAELQALSRKPMYMKDWIAKLDDFLKVSERDILTHAGRISHEAAIEKARIEYEKFRKRALEEPSPVERHFIEAVKEVQKLEKHKPRTTRKDPQK